MSRVVMSMKVSGGPVFVNEISRPTIAVLALSALQMFSNRAGADVAGAGSGGFEVREQVHVAAPAAAVYAALIAPNRWWDPKHTYSGDSARLSLDARAGGCWCETLPDGGSVQHMTVVFVAPGKALRLHGTLGPLQAMGATGSMTVSIVPAGTGADLSLVYAVGGYSKDGFETLSKAVDSVLSSQAARLQKLVETGSAGPSAP
jgi:uncharacterized protein YndB with AHSA1/START domain